MKTTISYRQVETEKTLETAVERHLRKIKTLLKHYAPDLIQLHGSFEKHARRIGCFFSVNLSLPTGTLHATGSGSDASASARVGFTELEAQIKKHQARLRKNSTVRRKVAGQRA